MPQTFTDLLADRFTFHAVDITRFEAHVQTRTLQLLKDLETSLVQDLERLDPTSTLQQQRRLAALLKSVRSNIQEVYSAIKRESRRELVQLAETVSDSTIDTINKAAKVSLLNVGVPKETLRALADDTLLQGAPAREWWSRQAGSLYQRFSNQIREGVYRGEPLNELVARVRGTRELDFRDGILEATRRDATSLVRTSVQSVHNAARYEALVANPDAVKGLQAVAVLDDRTTELCQARSGMAWYLDGRPMTPETTIEFPGPPPWHFNCRTTLIPVTYSWEELAGNKDLGKQVQQEVKALPKSTQASMDGQVGEDLNYEGWLKTKPEGFQKDILGPGKWELWKGGQLSLKDMIDQKGRPLSIEQLRQRLTGSPPALDDENARLLQLVPTGIQNEIRTLQELLAREDPDLFREARLVGSWAKQDPKRLPDRRGLNTSNLNLLLVPQIPPEGAKAAAIRLLRTRQADARARIAQTMQSSYPRTIDLQVGKVVGDPVRNKTQVAWRPRPTPIEPPAPPLAPPPPPAPPPLPPPPPPAPPLAVLPPPKPRRTRQQPAPSQPKASWTQETPGAEWHDATMTQAPDYIKRAIGNLPPVKGVTRIANEGAFYNSGTRTINMRTTYRSTDPEPQDVWRHEYGHHLDNMLGGGRRYISSTRTWEAAWRADAKHALETAYRYPEARAAADKRAKALVTQMKDIRWREGKEARDRWLREVFSQAGLNYDEWTAMINEGIKAEKLKAAGAQPITDSLRFLAAYEHGAVTSSMMEMWGSSRTTKMGTQFMDIFGAITKNQLGYGHSTAYYDAHLVRQGTEAFANVFAALSHRNPMWGKLVERFFPNLTRLVKGALENA